MLEGQYDILIEHALRFEFNSNKFFAKYKALIFCMYIALEISVSTFKAKSDSRLVVK